MNYLFPQKSELVQVSIKTFEMHLPELKNISESKAVAISKWLINWIDEGMKDNILKPGNLMPSKSELAYTFGVSVGTIQNALRFVEDAGYVESKQCIGTLIRDRSQSGTAVRKLTSKREVAINSIKKFIKEHKFSVGQQLPSARSISESIGYSANTTRLALEYLAGIDILEHKFKGSNDAGWILKSNSFEIQGESSNETLVKKIESDLKNYIAENLKIGDKLPAHARLGEHLKVSIKTIHDALKTLIDEGILLARRGRYGTTVTKMPSEKTYAGENETSIFASAQEDNAFYYYEKTQNHIRQMIAQNYEVGSKLPSIIELSKELDLSPNTIRKAFHNLAREGYLAFSRGRYGGTFVIDIPETNEQAFKWLAVNPKYAEAYKN